MKTSTPDQGFNNLDSVRREKEQHPPLDRRLHKAYVLLLEGIFHVTRLNELAEKLDKEANESAIEVARSALVIAGACMDASLKQTIQDNLLDATLIDPDVQDRLSKRIGRKLKKDILEDAQQLARLLFWGERERNDYLQRVV